MGRATKGQTLATRLRVFIAQTLNDELKAEGKADAVHVEHRSFKKRGSAQVRTRHQGPTHTNILRKERGRARQAWTGQQRKAQKERHGKELASLKLRQEFALQGKFAELTQRGRDGEAAIRRKLEQQQQADSATKGLPRLFQQVTGQAGRTDSDRQAREAQRQETARNELQALKADVLAERDKFIGGHRKDRAALIERHGIEDRQLSQVALSREFSDRAAERAARQPEARAITHEHGRGRSLDPS